MEVTRVNIIIMRIAGLTVICLLLLSFKVNAGNTLAATNDTPQLVFAATDWCPYTCVYSKHQGFVSEWLISVLQAQGWGIQIKVLPWQKALALSQAGEVDGLVTATPIEAPHLLFSLQAIDNQTSCFYRKAQTSWHYQGIGSLVQQRIGVISNYAYGAPIDRWLMKNKTAKQIYHSQAEAPLNDLLTQLQAGEISSLLADKYVLSHHLYQYPQTKMKLEQAGCLKANPFYIAVTPNKSYSRALLEDINHALDDANKQVLKEYIKYRYGLQNSNKQSP